MVKHNGLVPVVAMVTSTHTTMQNEALVGIVLAVNVINSMFFIVLLLLCVLIEKQKKFLISLNFFECTVKARNFLVFCR